MIAGKDKGNGVKSPSARSGPMTASLERGEENARPRPSNGIDEDEVLDFVSRRVERSTLGAENMISHP